MATKKSGKIVKVLAITLIAALGGWTLLITEKSSLNKLFKSSTPIQLPTMTQTKTLSQVGWKQISGNGVELSLPASYEGGKPQLDIKQLAARIKDIHLNEAGEIESFPPHLSEVTLFAVDRQSSNAGFLTNVNILPEKVAAGTTTEKFFHSVVKDISGEYQISEQKIVSLNQYPAVRIIGELTTGNIKVKQLFYAPRRGDVFWLITYSTIAAEFEQRLPTFEQSVRTFKVHSNP